MDLRFSVEEQAFRDELRAFIRDNLPTDIRDKMRLGYGAEKEDTIRWQRILNEKHWAAYLWPKEWGGPGWSPIQRMIFLEENQLAQAPDMQVFNITMIGPVLIQFGTDEQKKRFLPRAANVDDWWCQGFSEPGAGSDLAALKTAAKRVGDDYVVNGQKIWTSTAQHADWIFLLVRTDPEAPKHKGISYLLVDMKTPGITVRPLVQMTGASGFNEVFFDDVRVPKRNLVGEKNQGWQVAITTLMFERRGAGAPGTGQIRELARLAKRIPRNGGTAWDDSSVRQKLAEFYSEGEALKFTGFRQLTRRLKGLPPGPEGSMMKLVGTELALKVSLFAMELLGPYSQMEPDGPFAIENGKWLMKMLAVRGGTIAAGTNQIQHNIIGERVLGLPKG